MRFDTLERFGLRLSEVRALPCSDAWAALSGLLRDSRTHLYAAVAGQTFQGSHADFASVLTAQLVLGFGASENKKPPRLPGPFMGAEKQREQRQRAMVPAKERELLTQRLRQYSSIPD